MKLQYEFHTKPFEHQQEEFDARCEEPFWGLFWEQGCGKTKPTIDTACYLYEKQEIDCLFVVAPNGVHRNWVSDELKTHLPERLYTSVLTFIYQAGKANTKWHKREADMALKYNGLSVVVMSYDAFMTKNGKNYAWKLLRNRRCFYVLDESHYIKTPKAKRTRSIVASGKYAPYRRILTGTPIANSPFDAYSQVRFLQEDFWTEHRLGSFAAFKQHFGVWRTRQQCMEEWGYDPGYDQLLSYKNLDHLQEILSSISSRVTKDEKLDLPPKLYSIRYFDMTKEQRDAYEELKAEMILELEDGEIVDAGLAIVRLLRLQQIACGYVQVDADEPMRLIGEKNARLELLKEICEGLNHKAIIWARFRHDIDQIMEALGETAVRYDGSVSEDDRVKSKEAFQNGEAQFFVGNPQAGATGLTLTAARTVIYYSNSFKLVDRLQSEDRAHRIGQEHSVNYIDLIAPDTVDKHIVKALRSKIDVASQITGDELKDWVI